MSPSDFGGVDLVKQLNRRVSTDKPIVGRIQDKSAMSDFANVIGQAYAAQGLAVARSGEGGRGAEVPAQAAVRQGLVPAELRRKPTKNKQSCDGGKRKTTSVPDTDATALAVLSLLALPQADAQGRGARSTTPPTGSSGQQEKNGSFGGGTVHRGVEHQQHRSRRLRARCRRSVQGREQGRATGSPSSSCTAASRAADAQGREGRDRLRQDRLRRG